MKPGSDALLLQRIREDAPGAFDDFVSRFGGRIFAFGLRMCGEREDAKDVLQDTLLAAYRSLRDLDRPDAMVSWLYRVAANACLMKRRKRVDEPERELSLEELAPDPDRGAAVEIPDPGELPDDAAERSRIRERVAAAIRDLPVPYRIVLVMRDMEQLTTQETAEALGLELSAVKMRLHRARLMLRKTLEGALASPAGGGTP